jgi:hypothetical protein
LPTKIKNRFFHALKQQEHIFTSKEVFFLSQYPLLDGLSANNSLAVGMASRERGIVNKKGFSSVDDSSSSPLSSFWPLSGRRRLISRLGLALFAAAAAAAFALTLQQ